MKNIEEFLFDSSVIQKRIEEINSDPPVFVMGTDVCDPQISSYCLVRKTKTNSDILMCKSMRDKKKFEKEVKNLAKYFNATLIESK